MIFGRPSFTKTLEALDAQAETPEEHDLRELVVHVQTDHQSGAERPDWEDDPFATWGTCETCGSPWPCPIWTETESMTVEWLIRRSNKLGRTPNQVGREPVRLGELLPGVVADLDARRRRR